MHDISLLEECYKKFIKNISYWSPESIISIDLGLLHHFDLLKYHHPYRHDNTLTRYFHVVETNEKITLVNDDFVIWIVPEKTKDILTTYCLVALNRNEEPHLELVFLASGVYNTSYLVLRVLEKFLLEIQDTEDSLARIKNET